MDEFVYAVIPKADDLEVHLKVYVIGDKQVVSLREFVPSLNRYGKGVNFHPKHLGVMSVLLRELLRDIEKGEPLAARRVVGGEGGINE